MTAAPCEHGYPSAGVCPRCSVPFSIPPRRVDTHTRWHGTATTLGPRARVAITLTLIVPMALCLIGLSHAGHRPLATLLVLPFAVLLGVSIAVLPATWQPGRKPQDPPQLH